MTENKPIMIDGIDISGCFIKELYKQLQAKEQECEDLKSVRDMWMSRCEQEMKTSEFFQDRFDDLKRTLTEIKEIAEVEIECKTYEIENDCFNETRCKALKEHIDFIKQILRKIREC